MPEAREILTYKDCTSIKLNKYDFDFRDMRVGYFRQTAKFKVRGLGGLKWWILWYAGFFDSIVKFYVSVKRDLLMPCMYQLFGHVPTDVELVVDSGVVPAHKSFLSPISPVFNAMFSHNTTEAKSNRVKITDFDVESVQSAMDYRSGRKLKTISAETGINMLRFCDNHGIVAVIGELERLATLIPSTENFCQIVRYAYECNRDGIMADCCKFFEDHQDQIKVSKEFAELPLALVIDILKKAFDLKTDFDVLHHAQFYGITFVVDRLEDQLFIKSMSIDNFCTAVKFAWKWSREELQQVCAKYLNDNREVITDLPDFIRLPYEAMQGVLKTSHAMKRSVT
uniref:BTB domain-containing protein n=1 Tax=Panagrellus redivivus TaxID=6233 RepID=A0A7E4ZRD8_PANRE